jgi:DNA repair protein RadD
MTESLQPKPIPAHFGRSCRGAIKQGAHYVGCGYKWSFKSCEACGEENDISAKYCRRCRHELIDPNDKLVMSFKDKKRDPTKPQCDEVLEWSVTPTISKRGNDCLMIKCRTPYRSFTVWLQSDSRHVQGQQAWHLFQKATKDGKTPRTVAYIKDKPSGFYRFIGFNLVADKSPIEQKNIELGLTA